MATDREAVLVVTLRSAGGRGDLTLEVPGGVALRRLLPHLLTVAELPAATGDGRAVEYELVHLGRCCVLTESESLFANGVVTGDELILVARPAPSALGGEGDSDPDSCGQEGAAELNGRRQHWQQTSLQEPPHDRQSPQEEQLDPRDACLGRSEERDELRWSGSGRWRGAAVGRVVALWSGTVGGTGRTILSLGLGIAAAERGWRTALLGLAGPGLSVYLGLPRGPDVRSEIEPDLIPTCNTRVKWRAGRKLLEIDVVTVEAGRWSGSRPPGQLAALLSDARSGHDLVIVDLPPLGPGLAASALEPLSQASDLLLVVPPSALGVAATVDGLAYLEDLPVLGFEKPRVALVLNRRAPAGLPAVEFAEAVARVWDSCPRIAAEIDYSPDLAGAVDRGQLIGSAPLSKPVAKLAEVLLGPPDHADRRRSSIC